MLRLACAKAMTSKLDADQFEAERANAAARTAELERQMIQAENQLSVLLGRKPFADSPREVARGTGTASDNSAGPPFRTAPASPGYLAGGSKLNAATARIGTAKADRFPKISLTGLIGAADPHTGSIFSDVSSFGAAGAGFTLPCSTRKR